MDILLPNKLDTNNCDLAVKLIDEYKPQQLILPIDYYVKQLKDMNYEII